MIAKFLNKLLVFFDLVIARPSQISGVIEDAAQGETVSKLDSAAQRFIEKQLDILRQESVRGRIASQWRVIDHMEKLLPPPATLKCDICGASHAYTEFRAWESHCVFGGGHLLRHQCPACDAIFGPKKMMVLSEQELSQEYASHYSVYQEGDSTDLEVRTFLALNPDKGGVYLNYGAGGWSRSVRLLRQQGWNIMAYEPHHSGDSAHEAYVIATEDELSTIKFDGIFSNNVLEHFRHPVNEMRAMARLLKKGGKMSHTTPCFEYLYAFTRFHLFFYLGRSRQVLAEQAGLKIESSTVDGEFINYIYSVKQ